ncbi:hypothetical protein [Nonomuraea turcica]|uniref:hypothetical protein n=1 Tax=Nonomuraea sp. G32 TaxID=3067274 RepID=UPI00273C6268|nr:hypothetical protein [Nonomuraea sp. G32]MDP4502051.1 hypothetical protein [Nonomuraea sp. G32]
MRGAGTLCERLREEDLAIAQRTPGLRAEDRPAGDQELSDDVQEEQRLTQRRIFREQQEEARPRLRPCSATPTSGERQATGVIYCAVPRSQNST